MNHYPSKNDLKACCLDKFNEYGTKKPDRMFRQVKFVSKLFPRVF